MAEEVSSKWRSITLLGVGKFYEELPLGPKIMVSHPTRAWRPPMDVFECEDFYMIKLAVSGLKRADGSVNASVSVAGDTILIKGDSCDDCCHKKSVVHQMEIHYGPFECRVQISAPFDADGIEARYHDGFLEVTVPKVTTASAPGSCRVRVHF